MVVRNCHLEIYLCKPIILFKIRRLNLIMFQNLHQKNVIILKKEK